MHVRLPRIAIAAVLLALPALAFAQGKWKDIGTTSSGNHVSVDTRSIKHTGGLVSATVRVVFTPPVQTPQGTWGSTQTKATFDCAKKSLAARENVTYAGANGGKVVQRTVNKLPGYGPALKGSMGYVALEYLCGGK